MSPLQTSKSARWSRPIIGGLLLSLYLFVLALAQSGSLHEACHEDADRPDHQCAVTLLNSGCLDVASAGLGVVEGPAVIFSVSPAEVLPPATPNYFLLPGRGPPALLS